MCLSSLYHVMYLVPFLFSAFLRNFFLCQDRLTWWCASTLSTALLCSSRAGSWFWAYIQIGLRALSNIIVILLSEASREVANLTERKNTHTPVYGVKEFVCLSVCDKLWPQISQDWQNRLGWKIFYDIYGKFLKNFYLSEKCPVGPWPRAEKATFWPSILLTCAAKTVFPVYHALPQYFKLIYNLCPFFSVPQKYFVTQYLL